MVVLAAAVLTKTGRALLSRQFVDLTRVRIEGLLSAFPKLLNPDSQHTFIETANVRYLYQPIDALYVVIITTKQSNILEDLETLHLFAKVIPDTCRVSTEEEVCNKAFDLVFAFDEVVSLGYKENVTLPQIRTFIEMDSHEERIHDLVEKNKMKDVKAAAKRKQKEIRATQKSSMQGFGGGGRSSAGGMASRSMGSGNSMSSKSAPAAEPYVVDTKRKAKQSETRRTGGGGMKLGKGGAKKNDFLEHLVEEGDIEVDEYRAAVAPSSADASASATALPDVKHEAVHVSVEEKLTAVISNDGGLQSFDVVGEFKLTVREPAFDKVKIQLTQSDQNMQFKTHPNVNKQAFTNESRIETKRPDRGYPVGTSLGVVKWRVASKDESLLPLSVSCWPSPGADNTIVNVEYELLDDARELRNVLVTVPLPGGHVPVVAQVDGTHTFDHKAQCMQWTLPLIDQDSSTGSLEFTLPVVVDSAALFPIHVAFVTEQTFTTLQIESMTAPDVDEVKYSEQRALTVNYTVEN